MTATIALEFLLTAPALTNGKPIHDESPHVVLSELSGSDVVFDHDLNGTGTCGPFRPYIALGNIYACGFASNKRLGLCKNSLAGFGSVRTTVAYGQDAGGYSWEFRMQHNGRDSADIIGGLPTKYDAIFAKTKCATWYQSCRHELCTNWASGTCLIPFFMPPTAAQKSRMNELDRIMNEHLRDAAHRFGYTYDHVEAAFEGRRFWDSIIHGYLFNEGGNMRSDTAGHWYLEIGLFDPPNEGQDVMLRVLNAALQC